MLEFWLKILTFSGAIMRNSSSSRPKKVVLWWLKGKQVKIFQVWKSQAIIRIEMSNTSEANPIQPKSVLYPGENCMGSILIRLRLASSSFKDKKTLRIKSKEARAWKPFREPQDPNLRLAREPKSLKNWLSSSAELEAKWSITRNKNPKF